MKRWLYALAVFALAASVAKAQVDNVLPLWKFKLQQKLTQRMDIAVQDTPLTEVLAILRSTLNVNIVLDAPDATTGEMTITLDLKDVQADRVLAWITRQAGLEYALADEVIYISTRNGLAPSNQEGLSPMMCWMSCSPLKCSPPEERTTIRATMTAVTTTITMATITTPVRTQMHPATWSR